MLLVKNRFYTKNEVRQETIDALGDDLRASIEEKVPEVTASTEDRDMIG